MKFVAIVDMNQAKMNEGKDLKILFFLAVGVQLCPVPLYRIVFL